MKQTKAKSPNRYKRPIWKSDGDKELIMLHLVQKGI